MKTTMKLSEALVLRADVQKRIEQVRARLQASVLVQEGSQPPEDPQALFAELERLVTQLADLIARINRTNFSATLEGGETLTNALARRDALKLRISVLKSAADSASSVQATRYMRSELRNVPTVDVAALRQLELRWFGGHSMICRRANLRRCPDAESSCALSPRIQD